MISISRRRPESQRTTTGAKPRKAKAKSLYKAERTGLLSQTSEYALRALATLARLGPGESMRAADLARETGVPAQYLSKVLRRLVARGLLRAQKGHGGGFSLARGPSAIHVADVLEALDSAPIVGRCAFGWGKCNEAQPCPLHPVWSKLAESFQTWTSTTTLADVR
ncbi:MAG TPA: Rrf2 family transcriptional regulator [Polyangiaceae bacterium]|nr:Rrf2 family transcriptional regulator [Polyangiaceae bacterium]